MRPSTSARCARSASRPSSGSSPERCYDVREAGWVVAPGQHLVQVCENAAAVVAEQSLTLTGDPTVPQLTLDSSVGDWFGHPVIGATLVDELGAGLTEEQRRPLADADLVRAVASMPMRKALEVLGGVVPEGTLQRLLDRATAVVPHGRAVTDTVAHHPDGRAPGSSMN